VEWNRFCSRYWKFSLGDALSKVYSIRVYGIYTNMYHCYMLCWLISVWWPVILIIDIVIIIQIRILTAIFIEVHERRLPRPNIKVININGILKKNMVASHKRCRCRFEWITWSGIVRVVLLFLFWKQQWIIAFKKLFWAKLCLLLFEIRNSNFISLKKVMTNNFFSILLKYYMSEFLINL